MNPRTDCKRIGGKRGDEKHFMDMVLQRSFNVEILGDILTEGVWEPTSNKVGEEQDFRVKGRGWTIDLTQTPCTLTLWTVYRS
jgi:hypothetical protein